MNQSNGNTNVSRASWTKYIATPNSAPTDHTASQKRNAKRPRSLAILQASIDRRVGHECHRVTDRIGVRLVAYGVATVPSGDAASQARSIGTHQPLAVEDREIMRERNLRNADTLTTLLAPQIGHARTLHDLCSFPKIFRSGCRLIVVLQRQWLRGLGSRVAAAAEMVFAVAILKSQPVAHHPVNSIAGVGVPSGGIIHGLRVFHLTLQAKG